MPSDTGTATGEDAKQQDGTEPDARFTFANERTFLAWNRTALALVVAGLAIAQLLPPFPGGGSCLLSRSSASVPSCPCPPTGNGGATNGHCAWASHYPRPRCLGC